MAEHDAGTSMDGVKLPPGSYFGVCPVTGKKGEHSHVTPKDVTAALQRIGQGGVHRTMVATSKAIDEIAGFQVFFKCENFQRVGAFKFRGATNAVLKLGEATARRGVVTHSSGNMAQALALAARMRGIPAHIVMPSNAPEVKKEAVKGYGGLVTECVPTLEARETTAQRIIDETGATFIHPYDNPDVMAGQGTAALELLEDHPDLDVLVAPVGGGGLLSGTCIAAEGHARPIKVFGAEPVAADDAAQSMAKGELVPVTWETDTVCDGLLTSLGELTFPVLRDSLEAVLTVADDETLAAMRLLFERVLGTEFQTLAKESNVKKVGVILSGGNLNLDALFEATAKKAKL